VERVQAECRSNRILHILSTDTNTMLVSVAVSWPLAELRLDQMALTVQLSVPLADPWHVSNEPSASTRQLHKSS
jgi:hypothetical protein